jgi:hypothetical protein
MANSSPLRRAVWPLAVGAALMVVGGLGGAAWNLKDDASTPPAVEPASSLPGPHGVEPPPDAPPSGLDVAAPRHDAPQPPIASPVRPTAPPAALSRATVEKRLVAAHAKAATLASPAAQRMMGAQLQALERRLRGGASPREINRELNELLETFGAR